MTAKHLLNEDIFTRTHRVEFSPGRFMVSMAQSHRPGAVVVDTSPGREQQTNWSQAQPSQSWVLACHGKKTPSLTYTCMD